MNSTQGYLQINKQETNKQSCNSIIVDNIVIYGAFFQPNKVEINGNSINVANIPYDQDTFRLDIDNIQLDICSNDMHLLTWMM